MAKSRKTAAGFGLGNSWVTNKNINSKSKSNKSKTHIASAALKGEREEKGERFRCRSLYRELRRSGPGTPVPYWKLSENRPHERRKCRNSEKATADNGDDSASISASANNVHFAVSARKLAACLWALHQAEAEGQPGDSKVCGDGKGMRKRSSASISSTMHRLQKGFADEQDFQSLDAYSNSSYLSKLALMRSHNHGDLKTQKNEWISTTVPNDKSCLENDRVYQAAAILNPALEKATKWDSGIRKTSDAVFIAQHNIKTMEEHRSTSNSLVLVLQRELAQARMRVKELEQAQKSSQKEVDRFLKKISEEKAIWQKKEQERIKVVFQNMKENLNDERKAKRKMEVVNGKLAKELAEAKITVVRSLEDLEKERKARQLMEDVCDELAREIGEDKAEVEQIKRESIKAREEMEEERKMLQMAEVWREERVQMKLVDAKIALEEKSAALDKLRDDLETFINSRMMSQSNFTPSAAAAAADMRDAELLREAACSIQIQDMKEFSYQPPTSDDVFSAFGDLQPFTANKEKSDARAGWDPEDGCYSPSSHTSKILNVTPKTNGFNRNLIRSNQDVKFGEEERQTFVQGDEEKRRDDGDEDETEWDYASSGDEEGSSNSYQDSKTSLNGGEVDGSFSESGTDWEENQDSAVVITEIESYSPAEKLRTYDSSAGQLRGPNAGNGDCYKAISVENNLTAHTKSLITMTSPGQQSLNGVCSPSNLGTWSSPDAGNPHIARGIKGCVEWPRGIQKNSLKARLLEAKMESQKAQLRHVLKQKH